MSPTTLLYLYSCPQAISLAGFWMLMYTPFQLAPMAVQLGSIYGWGTKLCSTTLFFLYS